MGKFLSIEEIPHKGKTKEIVQARDGVACAIYNSDTREFLFVKQYRPTVDDYTLEIPAGIVEDGETEEEAIIREIFEETGISIDPYKLHKISKYYPSIGYSKQQVTLFICRDIYDKVKHDIIDNEVVDTEWVSLEEVQKMLMNNIFVDGKTITTVFFIAMLEEAK